MKCAQRQGDEAAAAVRASRQRTDRVIKPPRRRLEFAATEMFIAAWGGWGPGWVGRVGGLYTSAGPPKMDEDFTRSFRSSGD